MTESTILIVDDESAIRDMVGITLDLAGFSAISATDAHEAHVSIIDNKPDLILLDWMLPGGSGIELARRLRRDEITTNIPIIMLTAKASEDNKVQGLNEGVDDYITKPFSPRELVARIKTVLRRVNGKQKDKVLQVFDLKLDPTSHRISIEDKPVEMGPTEFRLLKFFLLSQEKVFSRDHIQDAVWGGNVYLEERTIDVHIRRLRKALSSVQNTAIDYTKLIQTVRGAGYRFSVRINDV
ncbi:MAG TPA: phosphate regulon transcriptional regulatory protein PhoB [Gammaproteobacteria bacterium]|uniref:Phosphate regulon transcriptional regulatory protein PhoB n=1 Tax=OM182 bacterium TaxID=2510334 RepID=A0A520S395_9GAMM|nr:phosphate regulon transcriptional regulatory protein PhoB [Gammaproteobacteria bacterium]RPG42949.1 MAG: phosphate regulon transcriptional regulatory protein PhoB [Gammaproteobacteria bacterium TMED163]RZO76924.1 MAG: phosphate regulon transcriptional regulatory protein PhoB [OM182 bacterium]HAU25101.1 phosphate regulon transcriptional regulatory protein PhoB [Gammaproteobacteria bacterium]HBQ00402.1 phosphate regulon transcriptional regulatory protein PhoB [Gammaproteobacteria bacterium]|tara:strand:+ start:391 stop:1107 length:717 start_codon:yes stop_codon:yes gene_type:complete